ncbi:hypothetical protein PIB30_024419 [Stylosanthes scabra]|uniref:Uncharacterized protein n=1 Tax=Stylosanthes scabra TaxID=79078 RepID=A0ABU6UD35_9FABA|nr:hypothetical protein [Stylosanthes scabra]
MGSGVIYYEYEKREKFEDYDMDADAELRTFKIRRYDFGGKSFVHPLHSVRFDPDRPYEIPIEALMVDKILSSSKDEKSSTERHGTRSFRRGTTSSSLKKPRSWELIPPSEGWMCDADDENEIGGMETSAKNEESSEEDPEEDPEEEEEEPEEAGNPEDGIPTTPSLPMDIDTEENYQRYIEELGRALEPSPLRSSQASDITGGVRSGSGRRERKEQKDRNKPRRALLEPMRTHPMGPCVRIQAWAARPIAELGTYAYAYEASMHTHRSIPASINRGTFHHFKRAHFHI